MTKPFDIADYCARLERALLEAFGEKLLYLGLQGSYLRGEATDASDIDIMAILETLDLGDMDAYRAVLAWVGDEARACGFICSRGDLAAWNPMELCHLKHTTKDLYGSLANFLPPWTVEDERNYIKISLNNLYHAMCHGYIHRSPEYRRESLLSYYKSAFFILQNTHYLESGCTEFLVTKAELTEKLRGEDRRVMETLLARSADAELDPEAQFALLFHWCQQKMTGKTGEMP